MRWPKYWSFSFSISPSNEHPGLISFRMGWLDLLAVQGTLKSLLQHHGSKASTLRCSALPNIPGSYAILLFTALDLASITSHIHNCIFLLLWLHPFILSGVISPLISSSVLGTYRPGEFLFHYPIILPFHTVHGVLKARILKWFVIPFSSGPYSVRPLHHDPSVLGGPTRHDLVSLS